MRVSYDKDSDAAYIYFREIEAGEAVDTQGEWPVHVDLAKNGEVLGIEIMGASEVLKQQILDAGKV